MSKETLNIQTSNRTYSVVGDTAAVNSLFDDIVKATLRVPENKVQDDSKLAENTPCTCGCSDDSHKEFEPDPEVTTKKVADIHKTYSNSIGAEVSKEFHVEPKAAVHQAPVKPTAKVRETNICKDDEEFPADKDYRTYRGFLLIKCPKCGEVKGFMSHNEIDTFHCNSCGAETYLEDLIPLTAICKCGKHWKYLTNLDVDSYELSCINCGSPIPVFYNDKKQKYETLLEAIEESARGAKTKKKKK
jgi:ribosomal protein S27E